MHNPILSFQTRFLPLLVAVCLFGSFCLSAHATKKTLTDDERELIMSNGALQYWKAVASLQEASTPEESLILAFINNDLKDAPPQLFNYQNDAARWLIQEDRMLNALRMAHEAPYCLFPVRQGNSPDLNLTHLVPIRNLSRHILQITKAYEFTENEFGASSLFRMNLETIEDLAQDRNHTSIRAAAAILQDTLNAFEGFISREPPAADLEPLRRYFKEKPELAFSPADYLIEEGKRYSSWLLEDDQYIRRLSALYRNQNVQPGVLQLKSLDAEQQKERMTRWIEGYQTRMAQLSDAFSKPYILGLGPLQDLDKELEEEINRKPSEITNPLIALLTPDSVPLYERWHLAKGHYLMIQVLTEAARYKDLIQEWPRDLKTLQNFTHQSFMLDPYSGDPIYFRIRGGAPRIILRVPKWIAKQEGLIYRIDVSDRKKVDDNVAQIMQRAAVQDYIRKSKNEPTIRPDTGSTKK